MSIRDKIIEKMFNIAETLNIPKSLFLLIILILLLVWNINIYKKRPQYKVSNILMLVTLIISIIVAIYFTFEELAGRISF